MIWIKLRERAQRGDATALATVVKTEGSSPAEPAMKMLVGPAGRITGTIGGGRVEAAVESKAREVLAGAPATILDFTLDDDMADEGGLICGGTVHVLVERVETPATWLNRIEEATELGRRAALIATIGPSVQRELLLGEAADPYLESEEPRLESGRFIEPIVSPRCIIVGTGHVGLAVARIAKVAGFPVDAVDDREQHAARVREVADRVLCDDLVAGFEALDAGAADFVVVMTRGHGLDFKCVRAALLSPARYVGMLASRRKAETIRAALAKDGVEAERLHAPIGLDLGATSAGEIAVAVVAQLVKVRRLGRGDR
ncbi:MAG: XdhC family protein [Planctomycetota bacterium]|nr:XdhC family protein [Planctomycetota bacterium]